MNELRMTLKFSAGDWIIHNTHGIGKVIAIEEKSFAKQPEKIYYRIETDEITIWVPADQDEVLRMLPPPEEYDRAVAILKQPSRRMSPAFKSRLARIRQARAAGTPQALARIVRDLWARQKRRGQLSNTEKVALRDLINQLLAEWSLSTGLAKSQLSKKFYSLLRQNALPAVKS